MTDPMSVNRAPLAAPNQLFINGEWINSSSTKTIDVIAPATEQLYARVADASVQDIDRAVSAARAAFDRGPWPRMSHAERAAYMVRLAQELEKRAPSIAQIWPNEMGILHKVATTYAPGAGGFFRMYAAMAETFPFEEDHVTHSGAKHGLIVREPVGVVAAIIPWNGAIMLIAFKAAPALLAGCTLVIKSAPEAPGHGLLVAEAAQAAGIPPGVINVVTAEREASEALVRHPGVDKIAFTGSSATGARIASLAGERIARYTLELGGKSAAIVLEDYDVETAAGELAARACDMTGQVCAALTRIIVPRHKQNAMQKALREAFAQVKVGDPFDPATQMGPLATRRQRDKVEGYIARARESGIKLAAGGGRPRHLDRGFFIEPTVFGDVDNRAPIAQEEVFGPVVAVISADNEAHAIDIANDSIFGLNGAVFTNDVEAAYRVARGMRTGTVGHNGHLVDFTIAFGGFKQSGVGREGGREGLLPYLETKTLLLQGKPAHRP
jgi:acyl-CoA reductase-like NAD-dependent aldehyde dehydrogenase